MKHLVPATSARLEELTSWVRAYFEHDGLVYDSAVEQAIGELLLHPGYGAAWFIEDQGQVAGYCVITYGFDHEAGGRIGVVTDLFLSEQFRGKGIGQAVFAELFEFARAQGFRQIELFVLKHNDAGRRFYERLGFEASSDREHLSIRL